jgi:hypothetical protein
VTFPYLIVFLVLFAAYLVYSEWVGLDARIPIAGALALLVVTAVVDAVGDLATANTFAEYVFFLLAGGVALLLVEHLREARRAASTGSPSGRGPGGGPAAEPPDERNLAAEKPLDRPQ